MFKGIVENVGSLPFATLVARFKDLGIQGYRTWFQIDWKRLTKSSDFAMIRKMKAAGFPACVCFTTKDAPPSPSTAEVWFKSARKASAGAVELWEVGNEPNLTNYWNGTLKDFVLTIAIPAASALKGELTCSASISKDLKALQQLKDLGGFNGYTYVGYHPYGYTPKEHTANVAGACKIAGSQKLCMTEWNMHGATPSGWAINIKNLWAIDSAQPTVSRAYYYRGVKSSQPAGKAGVFIDKTLRPNEPFYSTVKGLK